MSSFDRENLESVLRYLVGEYGIEILAGQGRIAGKTDIMRLLPDFFNAVNHKGDSAMFGAMYREGVLKGLVALKLSGSSGEELRRRVKVEIRKLTDIFLPEDVSLKYVQMVARVIGLGASGGTRQVRTAPAPKPQARRGADLLSVCWSGSSAEIEGAIRRGANLNAKDKYGWTALHWAAYRGLSDTAELLLRYGADVNARNVNGSTALHEAARSDHASTARVLLRYGADTNATNDYGRTALRLAAERGSREVAELLRTSGAKLI
ncbi:MAG: ankyrin repeat domain-containing protein [Synergistaceae bacterium]|nr:ankyrin repeat domain-containing protein [Synergistaceae bacterium]